MLRKESDVEDEDCQDSDANRDRPGQLMDKETLPDSQCLKLQIEDTNIQRRIWQLDQESAPRYVGPVPRGRLTM